MCPKPMELLDVEVMTISMCLCSHRALVQKHEKWGESQTVHKGDMQGVLKETKPKQEKKKVDWVRGNQVGYRSRFCQSWIWMFLTFWDRVKFQKLHVFIIYSWDLLHWVPVSFHISNHIPCWNIFGLCRGFCYFSILLREEGVFSSFVFSSCLRYLVLLFLKCILV